MIARTVKRHADRREPTAQASQKIQFTQPTSYDGFDLLPLGGEWKRGKSQSRLVDRIHITARFFLRSHMPIEATLTLPMRRPPRRKRRGPHRRRPCERLCCCGQRRS